MTTMQEYLALKAVSAGVLWTTLEKCPAAGFWVSPFNPEPKPADDTVGTDAGSIGHSILMEGSADCCVVIDPKDHPAERTGNIPDGWTNKSIKAARDAARATGKIPVLKPGFANIVAAVHSAQRYIESLKDTEPAVWKAFQASGGVSESVLEWDDDGVPCKVRPDRLASDYSVIVDAKFTLGSAEPDAWGRTQMIGGGYYLSAAFYQRAYTHAFGVVPDYLFLVIELNAPYLVSLVGCDPATLALGHRKIEHALATWRRCQKSGVFPGYKPRVAYPVLPPWEEAQWLEREIEEPFHGK